MKKLVIICYFLAIQIFVSFNSFCQRLEPFIEFESPSVPWGLLFTRDDQIISLDDDFVARLWEINTGKLQREFRAHSERLMTAALSPDGKLFATASKDKKICVWEISSGNLMSTLIGHDGIISGLSFSPDGKFLVSGGFDKTIRTWDFTNGTQLSIFPQTEYEIFTISFSPDGKLILSCGGKPKYDEPSEILVWDVNSKTVKADLSQFKFKVFSYGAFIFNSDNILLLDNPGNSLLEIDLKVRKIVNNFPLTPSKMHPFGITKDTDLVFCGSTPKITIFSRSRAFEPIPLTVSEGFTAFDIREDGKYFATGSDDKRVSHKIRVFQADQIPVMVEAKKLDSTNLIGRFEDFGGSYNWNEWFLVSYYSTPEVNKTLFGLESFHPAIGYGFWKMQDSFLDQMTVDDLYNYIQRNDLFPNWHINYNYINFESIPELSLYYAEWKKQTKYELARKKKEIINTINHTRKVYSDAYLIYSKTPFKVYGSGIINEDEYDFENEQATIHLYLSLLRQDNAPFKLNIASTVVPISLTEAENLFINGKAEGKIILKLLPGERRNNVTGYYITMPELFAIDNAQITFLSEKTKQKLQFNAILRGWFWSEDGVLKRWRDKKPTLPRKVNYGSTNSIVPGERVFNIKP